MINKKYMPNINFLKLAGINKLLLVEITNSHLLIGEVRLRVPFLNKKNNSEFDPLTIINYKIYPFQGDLSLVGDLLKSFSNNYGFETEYAVVSINDYRLKNITAPEDIENIGEWLEENSSQFLPAGKTLDSFCYSYEINTTEDQSNIAVAISQKRYVEKIVKEIGEISLKVINVSPSGTEITRYANEANNYLAVNVMDNSIAYTFINNKGQVFRNTIFETFISEKKIQKRNFDRALTQMNQGLSIDPKYTLVIQLSTDPSYYDASAELIKSQFSNVKILTPVSEELLPFHSFKTIVEKLIGSFDSSFNLLTSEFKEASRFQIEKGTVTLSTIMSGAVLIAVLLLLYFMESFIAEKLKTSGDFEIDASTKKEMLEKYKKENALLHGNLELLTNLKGNRITYSHLLKSLPEKISKKSCFTAIKTTNDNGVLNLELRGCAHDQTEVAEIMRKLETANNFKKVTLMFANSIEKSKIKSPIKTNNSQLIDFNFSAEYYAD